MKFEKKHYIFILFALLISFVALAQEITQNSHTSIALQFNSTNLFGTDRIENTTYFSNTIKYISVGGDFVSGYSEIDLYINNTLVNTENNFYTGWPETSRMTAQYIIPNNSNYRIDLEGYSANGFWYESEIIGNGIIYNNYTNYTNGSMIDNSTIQINESQVNNLNTDLNGKLNISGGNMTGDIHFLSGNITNVSQVRIGFPMNQTAQIYRFNNLQIFGNGENGTTGGNSRDMIGVDIGNVNTVSDIRTTLRVGAGSNANPNLNPNFVWQIYSNTHSTDRGLLALYDRKQLYFGCGSITNYEPNTECVIDFYTVNKTAANGSSTGGVLAMKIDGNKNITVIGQKTSGNGYDYVCVERATGKQINSPTACDLI